MSNENGIMVFDQISDDGDDMTRLAIKASEIKRITVYPPVKGALRLELYGSIQGISYMGNAPVPVIFVLGDFGSAVRDWASLIGGRYFDHTEGQDDAPETVGTDTQR